MTMSKEFATLMAEKIENRLKVLEPGSAEFEHAMNSYYSLFNLWLYHGEGSRQAKGLYTRQAIQKAEEEAKAAATEPVEFVKKEPEVTPAPVEAEEKTIEPEPAPTPVAEEPAPAPAPAPVAEAAAPTAAELRAKLTAARSKGVDVNGIMKDMGYTRLTEVPENRYNELIAKVEG